MPHTKPPINKYLTINHFGQLIQWRDQPEIVDGIEGFILFWKNTMEFTIAKNKYKGL